MSEATDTEWVARINGRAYRVQLRHYPDPMRLTAVVTVLDGDRRGETLVVPVHALRPDFSALDEPGQLDLWA